MGTRKKLKFARDTVDGRDRRRMCTNRIAWIQFREPTVSWRAFQLFHLPAANTIGGFEQQNDFPLYSIQIMSTTTVPRPFFFV